MNESGASHLAWEAVPITTPGRRGLNIVGVFEGACGLGEAARRYAKAIDETKIPRTTLAYNGYPAPHVDYKHQGPRAFAFDTNLLILNGEILPAFGALAGPEPWQNRYTIGLWFWELETIPDRLVSSLRMVNELWVSSNFLLDAFTAVADRPVRRMPLPVPRHDGDPVRSRAELGLPECFTFLSLFDFGSLALRKNALGTVEAFLRAFPTPSGPILVLKTMNANLDPAGVNAIRQLVGGREDVMLIDGCSPDEIVDEIIGSSDCFVSLHRSEGFGLSPAAAMAWGRPVIATGYSGNLDYMTDENAYLVPYTYTTVPPELGAVYPVGPRWAEPELDAAARLMQVVAADPAAAAARGARGQSSIRRSHSFSTAGDAIAGRMDEIWTMRAAASRARKGLQPIRRAG